MLEKRRYAREHLDGLRRSIVFEPRGHADMYGAIPTERVTPDGDLGVLASSAPGSAAGSCGPRRSPRTTPSCRRSRGPRGPSAGASFGSHPKIRCARASSCA